MRYIGKVTSSVSSPYALIEMARNQTTDEKVEELLTLDVLTIATDKVISLEINDSLETALEKLSDQKIKKLPVLEDGKIVGTLNRSDILRYIMEKSLK